MSLQVERPVGGVNTRKYRSKMGVKRKRISPPDGQQGGGAGLYIHSSPPRVMQMNPSIIRQWLRTGDLDKLEAVVLEGQGHKLVGEYSPDPKVRAYLKTLPTFLAKMEMAHEAVNKGRLEDLKTLLREDRRGRLVLCKDSAGVPLLHKAVFLGHGNIMSWLVENHPETAILKDKEGRTPLHYVGMLPDPFKAWELIEPAGADPATLDSQGHTASYYMEHPEEIHLPESRRAGNSSNIRRFTSGKDGLVVTRANIRIWIHDRDLGRLQQMLWEGHGGKLRVETSNNPRVKRFLDAVPYIMGTIKDVHTAVINDDLELYEKRTADPVPTNILISKDHNGLNPLHKAAGLGREDMVQDILQRNEGALSLPDNEGRTPLHYAAALRDGGHMYNLLVEAGADESVLDNRGKAPSHYRHKPGELDTKLLRVIPEAPRTATKFPPAWDWRLLNNMTYDFGPIATDNSTSPHEEDEYTRIKKQKSEANMKVAATAATAATATVAASAVAAAGGLPSRQETPIPGNKLAEDAADVAAPMEDEEEDEGVGEEGDHDEDEREDVVIPDVQQENQDQEEENHEETHEEEQEEEPHGEEQAEDEQVDRWERVPSEEDQDSGAGAEPESTEQEQDEEVAQLVEEGNMEQLANLVLDGQGERLIGVTSADPELQGFLNNVPAYMAKIRKVHEAAREGRLRDLQAALDRRKFAIAKDSETPLGATPLHLAVLFGHTPIVRYLAGRFPETMSTRDTAAERTPLHYAAALDDNGHYYNLLVSLGADTELRDEFGNTADYYMQNPGLFTKKRLLKKFGVEEGSVPNENLADQGSHVTTTSVPSDHLPPPVFWTEEGQYLANTLGEPLVKGLTEVANRRPRDPIAYLATFLYNFANSNNHTETPIQESPKMITSGPGKMADTFAPPLVRRPTEEELNEILPASESPEVAITGINRDEHGQSMLHFAANRSQGRNALFQLLQESDINIGYRDELYRTARDVAIQSNLPENIQEIDKWVLYLAARGETNKLMEFLLEGYDHIVDVEDEEDNHILDVVAKRQLQDTLIFLQQIPLFEERREQLHNAIRRGNIEEVKNILRPDDQKPNLLAIAKNQYSRCCLHVAVLSQDEEIIEYIVSHFPETLRIGDNLERTPLHYAMGTEKVEKLSNILIKGGAKRVLKDLKGRQPSYYFMNKTDILRLQEDEEALKV